MERRLEQHMNRLVLIVWLQLAAVTFGQNCSSECSVLCSDGMVICANVDGFPEFEESTKPSVERLRVLSGVVPHLNSSSLQNFINLVEFQITRSALEHIEPEAFVHSTAIISINLSDNLLTTVLPDTFQGRVRSVDLSNNDITEVHPEAFSGVLQQGRIALDDNEIVTLEEGVFQTSYRTISLVNNPLICDCRLRWLPRYWANVSEPDESATSNQLIGFCSSPSYLNATALNSLSVDQLICPCDPGCVEGDCNEEFGECECFDGWMGGDCSLPCPPDTYGEACSQNCTCVHSSVTCSHVNGSCTCDPGYNGATCESECSEGTYGPECAEVCSCQNGGICHHVTGSCTCPAGWNGTHCEQECTEGFYGLECQETCVCVTGECDPVNGTCTCPPGHFGADCSHDCSGAVDCDSLNREACSVATPENTCGPCLLGHVGTSGPQNKLCILCVGSPNCASLNREMCSLVENTCGPCLSRHITASGEGVHEASNETCFNPCSDGILNYNETDVDCGGPYCVPCFGLQACMSTSECGYRGACVGAYHLPSMIPYPYSVDFNHKCFTDEVIGGWLIERIQSVTPDDPIQGLTGLEVHNELSSGVSNHFDSIIDAQPGADLRAVSILPGDYRYQLCLDLVRETSTDSKVIDSIHSGRIKKTVVFNRQTRKTLFNF